MTDTTNGWPGKPGVPLNPEKEGWHWLQAKYYDDPVGPFMAFFWDADQQTWPKIKPYGGRTFHYLGPCLTHDQATALQARVAELEGALRQIEYLDRPQIRGLPRRVSIQEIALAALEGKKE